MKHKIIYAIQQADAFLITASNGLSISEGLHLFASNDTFYNLFSDYHKKYGIKNILQGCFFSYPNEEEKWEFWRRLLSNYVVNYQGHPIMDNIKRITHDKPYFIVTSNTEDHFERAGFSSDYIFEVEGSMKHIQCAKACHTTLYNTYELFDEIQKKPPVCPKCGGAMMMHTAISPYFIPNTKQQQRFQQFLDTYQQKNLCIIELGIGKHNQLIKAPIMHMIQNLPHATYITINKGEVYIPPTIQDKSYGIDDYIEPALQSIVENLY